VSTLTTIRVMGFPPPVQAPGYFQVCFTGSGGVGGGTFLAMLQEARATAATASGLYWSKDGTIEVTVAKCKGHE
jgi:hypothetical protein